MILYTLYDETENAYELNGELIPYVTRNSITPGDETYSFEREIIEKSFLPGSIAQGDSRLTARTYTIESEFAFTDDESYDDYIGELLYNLGKAVLLKDTTNSKQAKVSISSVDVEFDEGCIKRSGSIIATLTLLDGFWAACEETVITGELLNEEEKIELAAINSKWLETYPIVTLTADSPVGQFYIYIGEYGISIDDSLFGVDGYPEMIINCIEGTVYIGEESRISYIVDGTSFFSIPVGDSTIALELKEPYEGESLEIEIAFSERSYA